MKKITIEGKFTHSVNNEVSVDIYRPNGLSHPYNSHKIYRKSFKEIIIDLQENTDYNIDLSGYTTGEFILRITGDFDAPTPIEEKFEEDGFAPGYVIHTNH